MRPTELLRAAGALPQAHAAAGFAPSSVRNMCIRVRCITEAAAAVVHAELPVLEGALRKAAFDILDAAKAAARALTEAHAQQSAAQTALLKLRRTNAHALATGTHVLPRAVRYVVTVCACAVRGYLAQLRAGAQPTEEERAAFRLAGAPIAVFILHGRNRAQLRLLAGVHVRPPAPGAAVATVTLCEVDEHGDRV